MKLLDGTLDSPAENLACDEALLDLCENERVEILRFWESRQHFVVVGYGNRIETEVKIEECRRRSVPILRRGSGGGTVVQGPGCLNYSLTLRVPKNGLLVSVTGTNAFVMERNRAALEQVLDMRVSVQGHTDLAFHGRDEIPKSPSEKISGTCGTRPSNAWIKFSGNAQRRRREAVLFHGTILYDFDLSIIDELLRFPSMTPAYREQRSHSEFVGNVPISRASIAAALRASWNAREEFTALPTERIERLCRAQYANDAWIRRNQPRAT